MIPKIIHQIWEGRTEPLPDFYKQLGETWKHHHPEWQYEFWDGNRMELFIKEHFTQWSDIYFNYKYNVQRWDVIRYLILYRMGGMYVDFDYECFEPFDRFIQGDDKCYFAMEPADHCHALEAGNYFNNALMASPPGHPFFEYVIAHLETSPYAYTGNKFQDVLFSTGPMMLSHLYKQFTDKTSIDFFSAEQVSPWSKMEVNDFVAGRGDKEKLNKKLETAIAIHYFRGSWI